MANTSSQVPNFAHDARSCSTPALNAQMCACERKSANNISHSKRKIIPKIATIQYHFAFHHTWHVAQGLGWATANATSKRREKKNTTKEKWGKKLSVKYIKEMEMRMLPILYTLCLCKWAVCARSAQMVNLIEITHVCTSTLRLFKTGAIERTRASIQKHTHTYTLGRASHMCRRYGQADRQTNR